MLNSTHGKIGRGKSFFEAAFGKSLEQFHEILLMPEAFIIERYKFDKVAYNAYLSNGGTKLLTQEDVERFGGMTGEWRSKYKSLSSVQKEQAVRIIHDNIFTDDAIESVDPDVFAVLQYYRIKRYEDIPEIVVLD